MKSKKKKKVSKIDYESHCHECGQYDSFTDRDDAEEWFDSHIDNGCTNYSLYAFRVLSIKRRHKPQVYGEGET